MKQVVMKRLLIAGIALLTVPATVLAQQEKDKEKVKADKKVQTIVITRTDNTDDKVVIEVDGDKVKVNGKDAKDNKDVNVHVNTHTGGTTFYRNGDVAVANGFRLFSEDENRAMLGVTTEGDDKGAEILSITKESAAEKIGLKKGDIITKIDDRKIESSDDVTDAIRNHKPGDKVSITYLRDGKEQKATAELTKWKGVRMNAVTVPRMPQMQGLERQMEGLDRQWNMNGNVYSLGFGRPRIGLSVQDTEDGVGVKVLEVDDESIADKAGVREGDIILGVNDTDIKGTDDLVRVTRSREEGSSYKFKVKRGNNTQTLEVKIPRKLKTADL
jgi:serine protease Do